MTLYRYPGIKPYTKEQRHVFFGRDEDIENLYRLVHLESLVVLYSKSGLGKSSLINAGIVPKMIDEGKYIPLSIRFGANTGQGAATPMESTLNHFQKEEAPCYLDQLLPKDQSLWYYLKHYQYLVKGKNEVILIFDQFEELFTYPEEEIEIFKSQLREAIYDHLPQRFSDQLEEQYKDQQIDLSDEELEWLHTPLRVKVLMAIRSDRFSKLHQLTDYLPAILKKCYELQPLTRTGAQEAITFPATHPGDFQSPVFEYSDPALQAIMKFLTKNGKEQTESFQLQILCQYAEGKVLEKGLKQIRLSDLGNLDEVYRHYYDHQIERLGDPQIQLAARRLMEEGLVFEEEERRLALYEGQIFKNYGLDTHSLRKLVDTRLIRAEPSQKGGFVYELSHDTLVAPVLLAKANRKRREEQVALLKKQEEQEAKLLLEQQKRRRAVMLAVLGFLLFIFATIATIAAIRNLEKATAAKGQAEQATQVALEQAEQAKKAMQQARNYQMEKENAVYQKYIQEGTNSMQNSEFAEAVKSFEFARSIRPDDPVADSLIAVCQVNFSKNRQYKNYMTKAAESIQIKDFLRAAQLFEAAQQLHLNTQKNVEARLKLEKVKGDLYREFIELVDIAQTYLKAEGCADAMDMVTRSEKIIPFLNNKNIEEEKKTIAEIKSSCQ